MSAIRKCSLLQYVVKRQKTYQNTGKNSTFSNIENIFLGFQGDLESFFQKELENSILYENIASYLGCSRDEAKVELLRYFFGKHYSKKFPVNHYFNTNYPTLHLVFGYLKEHNKKNYASILQQKEAELFIHTIAKRIIEENPNIVIYTIHDAIVCEEGADVDIVTRIVEDELSKRFLNPQVKRKVL